MFTAFVLAAGFGTRLQPLTHHLPKPLVPVCGVPMLAWALASCRQHGLDRALVNAHHLAEHLRAWRGVHEGVEVDVVVEHPDILGTGGGLRAVRDRLAERFVVVNGDTLADVDLAALRDRVPGGGGCMALRPHPADAREKYGIVAYDDAGLVTDLKGMARAVPHGAEHHDAHFTGIHGLDRAALDLVPPGPACIVRTVYVQLVPERKVQASLHAGLWLDVGDVSAYLDANLAVLRRQAELPLDPWSRADVAQVAGTSTTRDGGVLDGPVWLGRDVRVTGTVRESVLAPGVVVPANAMLDGCVVWEGAQVPPGVWRRTVFFPGGTVAG
jgi:mannose-1-phosphate guanylyltransferase